MTGTTIKSIIILLLTSIILYMLEECDMDPNGKFFKEKLEVTRVLVDRSEQGRASKQIGLGCSDQRK